MSTKSFRYIVGDMVIYRHVPHCGETETILFQHFVPASIKKSIVCSSTTGQTLEKHQNPKWPPEQSNEVYLDL